MSRCADQHPEGKAFPCGNRKKWLEKYCIYEKLDFQQFKIELSDFLELLNRCTDREDKLMMKMLSFQSERIYLSSEVIEKFSPANIKKDDVKKKTSGSGVVFSSGFISYGLDLI